VRSQTNDPRRTAKLVLIELHYEQFKDELTWSAAKFRRLAHSLSLTSHELGSIVRISIGDTEKYLKCDRFPDTIGLHLALIARLVWPNSAPPLLPDI
jgi:hypothetical protein